MTRTPLLPEYDRAHPSRDPAREECPDEECGGSLTSHWNGRTEVVTCARCGQLVTDDELLGEGEGEA
jgi:hypothetical protein